MRTLRERQINLVASILRDHLESFAILDSTEAELLAEARQQNDSEGWTFDMAGDGPGNWLRCEGVALDDEEWATALAIIEQGRDEELVDVQGAADMLGLSYQRADQLVRDGRLPVAVSVGRGAIRQIRAGDVRRYATERRPAGRPRLV